MEKEPATGGVSEIDEAVLAFALLRHGINTPIVAFIGVSVVVPVRLRVGVGVVVLLLLLVVVVVVLLGVVELPESLIVVLGVGALHRQSVVPGGGRTGNIGEGHPISVMSFVLLLLLLLVASSMIVVGVGGRSRVAAEQSKWVGYGQQVNRECVGVERTKEIEVYV